MFLKASEWFTRASDSEIVALVAVDAALDGVAKHMQSQKLMAMIVPYTIEAGLSMSMEPSMLYNFTSDERDFYHDTEVERGEPPLHPKDFFCGDKAKGPEKLAKRYIYPPEEDVRSNASSKKSRRSNISPLGRRATRSPSRMLSSSKN